MRMETRHSVVLLVGTGTVAVLSLIYSVYAQRILGPVGAGDFVAALSLLGFINIALGPINATVTRFTAQYASRKQYGKIQTLTREIAKRVALYVFIGLGITVALLGQLRELLQFH